MPLLSSLTNMFKRLFVDKQSPLTYTSSMAITFDQDYKHQVALSMTVRIGKALRLGELPEHELCEVCSYVDVAIDDIKSHEELNDFIAKMARRWKFFTDILDEINKTTDTVDSIEDKFQNRQLAGT